MGAVWMIWPPGVGRMTEEDLGHPTLLLFRQRPGAIQKLEQWMERWSKQLFGSIPETFRQLCKQAHEAAQQDTP